MPKKRLIYLDFLKTLAIFIVITLHNSVWRTNFMDAGTVSSALQFCARLFCEGVPVFVLINGFLIFDRPYDGKKHWKRTINILVILLLWSVILEVALTLISGSPLTFSTVLTNVLETYIDQKNTGVLWFLQKLFVVYLLFPVLKHLYDTHEKLFNYILLVLTISTYGVALISMVAGIFDVGVLKSLHFFSKQYALTMGPSNFVVYFMLGGYLKRNWDSLPKKKLVIAGGVCAVLAVAIGLGASFYKGATYPANFNYSQIFLLFTIVGAFLVCSKIPFNNRYVNAVLTTVGDNTMGIYLLHQMVIRAMGAYLELPTDTLWWRLLWSLVVLAVSLGVTCLLRKIPKVSYLVKL